MCVCTFVFRLDIPSFFQSIGMFTALTFDLYTLDPVIGCFPFFIFFRLLWTVAERIYMIELLVFADVVLVDMCDHFFECTCTYTLYVCLYVCRLFSEFCETFILYRVRRNKRIENTDENGH